MGKARPPARSAASPNFELETPHWAVPGRFVCGIDEVGRGCYSGPTVAAATIIRPGSDPAPFAWARDSKQLSRARISEYATAVRRGEFLSAGLVGFGFGAGSVREIDRYGIGPALYRAMRRAAAHAEADARRHGMPEDAHLFVLVDGVPIKQLGLPHEAAVKGDSRSISIAISSVLAKHLRDTLLQSLARRHPAFACWTDDVGYHSAAHDAALAAHGPLSGHHRLSFAPVAALARARGIPIPERAIPPEYALLPPAVRTPGRRVRSAPEGPSLFESES
jgi:ribonuclease HII